MSDKPTGWLCTNWKLVDGDISLELTLSDWGEWIWFVWDRTPGLSAPGILQQGQASDVSTAQKAASAWLANHKREQAK